MSSVAASRPSASDYAPSFGRYINLVPEGDILAILETQLGDVLHITASIPESKAGFRYAPEKWSIREALGHTTDTERIFAYRALRFARNDQTPAASFAENEYVQNAIFDQFPLKDLAAEFQHVRQSTLDLFRHLPEEAWLRRGVASNNEISVQALAYLIAGHVQHHLNILRTSYLGSPAY